MKGNLEQLTIEELKLKHKRFKTFVAILSVLTLITIIILFYLIIQNNSYNVIILTGGCSFALLLCSIILKKVEAEIKSRNLE